MRRAVHASHEPLEQRPPQPLQRVVPQIRRAQLERRDAKAVTALLRQVRDEAGGDQLGEQWYVVDRGSPSSRAAVAADTGPARPASSRSKASPRRSAGTSLLAPTTGTLHEPATP